MSRFQSVIDVVEQVVQSPILVELARDMVGIMSIGGLDMSIFRYSDYGRKKEKVKNQKLVSKKTRQPTQLRTKKLYCRNCLTQLEANGVGKPCKQCEKTTVPLKRRK